MTKVALHSTSVQFLIRGPLLVYFSSAKQMRRGERGRDNEGSTPLHLASAFGDVVSLLLEHGGDVRARDSEGSIALHTATALGKTNIVQVLADARSDVNVPDRETPLHVSAGSGHVEVVHLLLDSGADLCAVDQEGRTTAACAKLFGHKKVEQCLQGRC